MLDAGLGGKVLAGCDDISHGRLSPSWIGEQAPAKWGILWQWLRHPPAWGKIAEEGDVILELQSSQHHRNGFRGPVGTFHFFLG